MALKDTQHPTLAARLLYILETAQMSKSELARELGVGPSTVGNWINRNGTMEWACAFRLQDKLKWNARWLLEGVGPRKIASSDAEAEQLLREILDLPPERRRALMTLLKG
jgi:transcriptional regulator with XRE-family HTH domain